MNHRGYYDICITVLIRALQMNFGCTGLVKIKMISFFNQENFEQFITTVDDKSLWVMLKDYIMIQRIDKTLTVERQIKLSESLNAVRTEILKRKNGTT